MKNNHPSLQKKDIVEIARQKLKVHKSLHDLFGRETTMLDLFAISLGSMTLTFATQIFNYSSELSLSKKIILALLTLDIGGGVIANFTTGTNSYYSEKIKRRYLFILIHILQPLVLMWIFPNNVFSILPLTFYILLVSFITTNINEANAQKIVAITWLLIGIILTFFFTFSNPMLQLILMVYSIKLILAFSVNWTTSNQ